MTRCSLWYRLFPSLRGHEREVKGTGVEPKSMRDRPTRVGMGLEVTKFPGRFTVQRCFE